MDQVKHTPTPWRLDRRASARVVAGTDDTVATTGCQGDLIDHWPANAAFIVRACNAHDLAIELLESASTKLWECGQNSRAREIDAFLDTLRTEPALS